MAKKDSIDVLPGIDLAKRRIYFGSFDHDGEEGSGSDFKWASVENAIRALHKMAEGFLRPIEIHMSSMGGDPAEMLRLYDEIQACPCQVKFVGGGWIASSATWIMCGCDERIIHRNSQILLHDGEFGANRKTTDGIIDAAHEEALQDSLNKIFAENSKMPVEFWEQVVRRDLWITAEEALKLGLVDRIIEPRKRSQFRKKRDKNLAQETPKEELDKLTSDLYARIKLKK
jgi:ATP-dependent protease ClpP protease subunit